MKEKWVEAYLDVAERFSQLSPALKLKVGAVVVQNHRIISIGYNGTPPGWNNQCENIDPVTRQLETKPEVIHAEANALLKLARDGESGQGATLLCTHAPCINCAKLIYGVGINSVYYRNVYKNDDGVQFLNKCGVHTEQKVGKYFT